MANNDENLNIRIGGDPSDIEGVSKAAAAAIRKVTGEASDLDRAFKKLRGSLDPLYAAQTDYNRTLEQLDMLLSKGALSETQYAASVDRAREALAKQTNEQLKGTAVANEAAAASKTASIKRVAAETAASDATIAASRKISTARAVEEASATLAVAREAKARTAIALQEAKQRLAEANKAKENVPTVNRSSAGRFVSRESVEAERAAAAEEAQIALDLAQTENTIAGQRVRGLQRIATTREEAALRAQAAEETAAEVSVAAAAEMAAADEFAAKAAEELGAAQTRAAAASMAAAAEQAAADRVLAEATAMKAKTAAEAAIAEELAAAATAKAAAATAAAALEARKAEAAEKKAAVADAQRAAAADRLKASLDKAYAAQLKYNTAIKIANDLAESGHIDEPTKVKALAAAEDALAKALAGGTKHTINNRAASEALVLVHEGLSKRWTRMTSSLMIMAQAMAGPTASAGAMSAVFSPLGIVIGATAVALGAFAFAAYKGSVEQGQLQKSLAVTGQYAGMTAAEIDTAAEKIATSTKTSSGEATASLGRLAASGRVTGQTMVTMGEITARLASLTGEKAEEITASLVKMADDPTAAMKKLQDQYHFLTPAQEAHIRNLQEEGNKTQAVTDLSGEFNRALKSEQTELDGLAGFAHRAAVALGDVWQSMKDIGKAEDPTKRLVEINKLLANNAPEVTTGFRGEIKVIKSVADLRIEAAGIQKKLDADTAKSKHSALVKEYDDNVDALDKLESTTRTSHDKMLREQKAWRTEANAIVNSKLPANEQDQGKLNDAKYRLAHPKETDDSIAKKFDRGDIAPKTKAKKGPSEISQMQEELQQQLDLQKNYFKDESREELDFWTAKLAQATKGSATYISIESKLHAAAKRVARQGYADQLEALKLKVAEIRGNLELEGKAWQAYLDKIKSVMGATSKEYLAAEKEHEQAEQEAADRHVKLMEKQEKDKEQPQVRKNEDTQTSSELKGGALDFQHSQGLISDRKYAEAKKALLIEGIQQEQAYEDTINQMRMNGFQEQLKVLNLSPEAIKTINEQIEAQTQQHEDKLNQIRDKGLLAYQKANEQVSEATNAVWTKTYDAVAAKLDQSLKAGIAHGFNFRGAMRGLAVTVLDSWVSMGTKMLATWVKNMLFQKATTAATTAVDVTTHAAGEGAKTVSTVVGTQARVAAVTAGAAEERSVNLLTALKAIGANAAKAASGAYAALAGIPIIGPVLGGIAAAGTFAAVMALGAFVSASGGQAEVPVDGQLSLLHKKEMVLPAWAANPLRENLKARNSNGMFSSTAAATAQAKASNDDTAQAKSTVEHHMHLHGAIINGSKDLEKFFKANSSSIAKAVHYHSSQNGR